MKKVPQDVYLKRFKEITEEMYETTKRKNSDYTGDQGDAFRNFTMVEQLSAGHISTDSGFFTRMTDKMMRFAGFIRNGTLKVADEKIEDTVLDLAVYCILYVCWRRAQNEEEQLGSTGGTGKPVEFDSSGSSTGLEEGLR